MPPTDFMKNAVTAQQPANAEGGYGIEEWLMNSQTNF